MFRKYINFAFLLMKLIGSSILLLIMYICYPLLILIKYIRYSLVWASNGPPHKKGYLYLKSIIDDESFRILIIYWSNLVGNNFNPVEFLNGITSITLVVIATVGWFLYDAYSTFDWLPEHITEIFRSFILTDLHIVSFLNQPDPMDYTGLLRLLEHILEIGRGSLSGQQLHLILKLISILRSNMDAFNYHPNFFDSDSDTDMNSDSDSNPEVEPAQPQVFVEIRRLLLELIKKIASQDSIYRDAFREEVDGWNEFMGDNGEPHAATVVFDFLYTNNDE